MSRASMISRSVTLVGWLKNRRIGGTPNSVETLLRGASIRSATRPGQPQFVGQLDRKKWAV